MLRRWNRLRAVAALTAACSPSTPSPATPASTPVVSDPAAASPASATPPHADHEHADHEHGFHKDFSDAEGFAAHFDDPARDAWQHPDAVLELMRIPPRSTVVDLGAGTGYFVGALSQRVGGEGKVLALDVEPRMIEYLGRRVLEQSLSNVEPRLVKPDDPGLAPASVSRVLIVNTWHHIDARGAYAQKLAAALTPDGSVWIIDFTLDSDLGPPAKYRLAAAQVVQELERGGLHAELIEPDPLPHQYIVRATR
jgi:predicted methyltransferase